jgi:uncharacterized Zn finger protein (UPF0148 family)
MNYCSKCGTKLQEGDMYCVNCGTKQVQISSDAGKQINESEQPVHSTNYVNLNPPGEQQQNPNSQRTLKNQVNFADSKDILIKMILKPVTGAKEFVKSGEKGAVIGITLLLTIMQGLLGVWKANQVIASLEKLVIDLVQKITTFINLITPNKTGNLLNSNEIIEITEQINKVKALINIPYGKIFLQNSGLFIISLGILFIIIYLGTNILSKNRIEAFTIYKTALIVLVPTLYFELFSVILSYLSFYLGFGITVIGVIISVGCLTLVIKENLPVDENSTVFIVAVSFIAIFIGLLISLQSFISSDISDIIISVTNILKTF